MGDGMWSSSVVIDPRCEIAGRIMVELMSRRRAELYPSTVGKIKDDARTAAYAADAVIEAITELDGSREEQNAT